MPIDSFTPVVSDELKWYVYRLIDPRNGETFYVGKGRGNRVFDHAKGIVGNEDEHVADPKTNRIHEIRATGLEVGHIIHRHGIATDKIAYEVEAALIDAYPGLVNKVAGRGSKDYGSRHVAEIVAEYEAEPFEIEEPLILISIGNTWRERGIYDAVRSSWKIQKERAERYRLILAHVRGVVKGVYIPDEWLVATRSNFPDVAWDRLDRIGFVGKEANPEVWNHNESLMSSERRAPPIRSGTATHPNVDGSSKAVMAQEFFSQIGKCLTFPWPGK